MTRRLSAVLIAFLFISALDGAVLWRTRQRLLGVHEDHFDKGVSLYETGSMSSGSKPMIFRPPGYPVFVAGVLAIKDAAVGLVYPLLGRPRPEGGRLVAAIAAQAVLLGVLGAALMWFAFEAGTMMAASCAIAVGCNPLFVVLAGHISYELLHLVLLTIATVVLLKRLSGGAPSTGAMFGDGLIWGVVTLVKSVTLVAPLFLFLWSITRNDLRNAARMTAAFSAGLLLIVAPYTARNYAVTHRFIPVNEQASFALWATSLERIPPGAGYLNWVDIWITSAMPTYTEITGTPDYSTGVFEDHVLELSDRFQVMARENLRRDPGIYAYNAAHNASMFLVDQPTSHFFGRYAWPGDAHIRRTAASLSIWMMTLIAIVATIAGSGRRDPRWTLLLTMFVMMWAAHALTFLESRYLYVKLPTIAIGFVLFCVAASTEANTRSRQTALWMSSLAAALSIGGLAAL